MPSLRDLLARFEDPMSDPRRPRTVTPQIPAEQVAPSAAVRPRSVMPQSVRAMMATNAQQPIATTEAPIPTPDMRSSQPTATPGIQLTQGDPTRERRAGGGKFRDFVADDSAYLRDLEAQPRNWKDKSLDVIRGLNAHFNPGSGPGMPSKREREIERARGALGRDLAVEKQQADAALKSIVPTTLADGTVVYGPARGAGTLASQQQRIKQQGETLTARKARWKQMGQHEAVQDALRVYNSGGANDPETLAAISETLGLPKDLQPKFNAGEIVPKVGDDGEIKLVNKRDGSVVSTGVKDYETTKEKGRFERQERSATAAMARTQAIISAGVSKLGDPSVTDSTAAELEDQAAENDEEADRLTAAGFPSQAAKAADRAVRLRGKITELKEAANKARSAQGATAAPKAGRTIDGAIKAFERAQKRPPTADEIARMKKALGQ